MNWDQLSIEERHAHWGETERQLRALMAALGDALAEAEAESIGEFIDHNEFGLALETVFDDLIEDPHKITPETVHAVQQLASRMKLHSRNWIDLKPMPDL